MAEADSAWGPDPRWPSQVVDSAASERPYNRSDCPYCGIVMYPLPKAKKKCPACGQAVYVRSGPDDIRYLLREADLAAHEARWGELYGAAADTAAMTANAEAARMTRDSLASYAAHGVRFVDLTSALSDACPACQAVAGRRFALADAPRIPIAECTNEICRCDYLPVTDGCNAPLRRWPLVATPVATDADGGGHDRYRVADSRETATRRIAPHRSV